MYNRLSEFIVSLIDIESYIIITVTLEKCMGRLQGTCNRLRLRLLENIMITITITRFLNVIDYDYDYIVK